MGFDDVLGSAGRGVLGAGKGLLDILSRPHSGVLEAVVRTNKELAEGDPEQAIGGFLSGMLAGVSGQAKPGINDIFTAAGVGRKTMDNPAIKYGKHAVNFAMDPLLVSPGPSKWKATSKIAEKAGLFKQAPWLAELFGVGRSGLDVTRVGMADDISSELDDLFGAIGKGPSIPPAGHRPIQQGERISRGMEDLSDTELFYGVGTPVRPYEEQMKVFFTDPITGEVDKEALGAFSRKIVEQTSKLPEYKRKVRGPGGKLVDAPSDIGSRIRGSSKSENFNTVEGVAHRQAMIEGNRLDGLMVPRAKLEELEGSISFHRDRLNVLDSSHPNFDYHERMLHDQVIEAERLRDYIVRGGEKIIYKMLGLPPDGGLAEIIGHGPSPLNYARNIPVSRISRILGDDDAGEKAPRPYGAESWDGSPPLQTSFVDYSAPGLRGEDMYIHYMQTHPGFTGKGHSSDLVQQLYNLILPRGKQDKYTVDWGKIYHENAAAIMEKMREQRPDVYHMYKNFWSR